MSPTGIRPPYAPSSLHHFICNGVLPLLLAGTASAAIAQQQTTSPEPHQVVPGERLSAYLARQPKTNSTYYAGIQWQVPQERIRQQALQQQLMLQAASFRIFPKLVNWLKELPATGRVALGVPDERWLFANPSEDPILQDGQTVVVPIRPTTVTVVLETGDICQVPHHAGALAWQYLAACTSRSDANNRDQAWVSQPDGQQLKYGISLWNAESQLPPAPGAWIWAPNRTSEIPDEFSERLSAYLATQGAAADGIGRITAPLTDATKTPSGRSRDLAVTASDWGEIGLLQTPTARMAEEGAFRFHASRTQPYTRGTVIFQPLSWLEGGFRYSDVADRRYSATLTTQSFKDKSIDIKIRLLEESEYIPQVSAGARDIGGTGLFSGEYLVANKRFGNFDWSIGLGWGYLGARGNLSNPLSLLSNKFDYRPVATGPDITTAGSSNFDSYLRGRTSLFGGVQWTSPIENLIFKMEYDGNNYQTEPAIRPIDQKSPINFGIVYRATKYLDVTAGIERGNKAMIGITLHNNLASSYTPKAFDPPYPALTPTNLQKQNSEPDTSTIASDITEQTNWQVQRISQSNDTLTVNLEDGGTTYRKDRLDRAIAVLNQHASPNVKYFSIDFDNHGFSLDNQKLNRQDWLERKTQAHYPTEFGNRGLPYSIQRKQGSSTELYALHQLASPQNKNIEPVEVQSESHTNENRNNWALQSGEKFSAGITPSFWQSFGGPDSFMLYQLGVRGSAEYRLTSKTWLSGSANLRLIDNYDKFKYTAPSRLPRVRTYMREYATTSQLTLSTLQINHAEQITENQFAMVYGGLLEPMFAGVGGEWLYRPIASRWSFGLDINRVKQRDFEQRFSMRDYSVTTGHATAYWDTGWMNINASLSIGQYLAGDRGATVTLSKRFENGILLGGWATKTNISSAVFGEGSFDKGIFITIPFDLMLPKSSSTNGTFIYQPLTRDGGAKLGRAWQLYPMTSTRERKAFEYTPSTQRKQEIAKPETGSDILWPTR